MATTHNSTGRQVLWIISAIVLCILIPLVLYEATGGRINSLFPWWSLAVIVLSGMAYASVIASSERQLFGMVLWLFTYIFMGLAPYVQFRFNMVPTTTPYTNEAMFPLAGSLVLISASAVILGSTFARLQPRSTRKISKSIIDPRRANILSIIGFILFIYYSNAVGIGSFLLSRAELSSIRSELWPNPAQSSLLTGSLHMVLLIAFIAQMTVRQQRLAEGIKPAFIPAFITGALLLYVVNPISSPRYMFGTVALAVLATFGAYATINRFRIVAAGALLGMLTIFPLADLFRYTKETALEIQGPVEAMTSGDFDAFVQLSNTFTYVSAEGHTWGGQLLGVLLFWVPRSFWPTKPQDTGVVLANFMDYKFTNLSSPIWSELFIEFGWVGVIIGLGIMGYLFRTWDAKTEAFLRTSRVPPIVVSATAFYMIIVLRGSLLNAASYLLIILLGSWFVLRSPRRGYKSHRSADNPATHKEPTTSSSDSPMSNAK